MASDLPALRPGGPLDRVGPSEPLYLDPSGRAIDAAGLRRWQLRAYATLVIFAAVASVLCGVAFGPLGAVGAASVLGAETWFLGRRRAALGRALALVEDDKLDDAEAALRQLAGRRLGALHRAAVERGLARIHVRRGDFVEAGRRLDRTLDVLRASRTRGTRAQLATTLVEAVLAALARGDLDRARAYARELDARALDTDAFALMRQLCALLVAFHAGDARELPDDAALHDWARAALGRSRFGSMLVALAWAFVERGDEDMARHLLAEAPERLQADRLATSLPRLHAWFRERAAAWSIPLPTDPV